MATGAPDDTFANGTPLEKFVIAMNDQLGDVLERLHATEVKLKATEIKLNLTEVKFNDLQYSFDSYARFVAKDVLYYQHIVWPLQRVASYDDLKTLKDVKDYANKVHVCLKEILKDAYDGFSLLYQMNESYMNYNIKVYVPLDNGARVSEVADALDAAALFDYIDARLMSYQDFYEVINNPPMQFERLDDVE